MVPLETLPFCLWQHEDITEEEESIVEEMIEEEEEEEETSSSEEDGDKVARWLYPDF